MAFLATTQPEYWRRVTPLSAGAVCDKAAVDVKVRAAHGKRNRVLAPHDLRLIPVEGSAFKRHEYKGPAWHPLRISSAAGKRQRIA